MRMHSIAMALHGSSMQVEILVSDSEFLITTLCDIIIISPPPHRHSQGQAGPPGPPGDPGPDGRRVSDMFVHRKWLFVVVVYCCCC